MYRFPLSDLYEWVGELPHPCSARPYGFVRCHNCYLVNLRYIDGMSGSAIQVTGNTLPVSRSRRKGLLETLMNKATGGNMG